jgi:hypothetical protein
MQDSMLNGGAIVPSNGSTATQEGAALVLLQLVANAESKHFDGNGADKKWILDTYAECLRTVRSGH